MKEEKLIFKNKKGQKLIGILFKPRNKKMFPIAVYCHGYRSDKNSSKTRPIGEKLTSSGIGFFVFDLTGRGESEGKFEETTITQYINDLSSCISFISKYTKKIAVIGNSLGGLVTLHTVKKEKRIRAIILLSPVSHFPWKKKGEFSLDNIRKWKKTGYTNTHSRRFGDMRINYAFYEDGQKYSHYENYQNIEIPSLIFHGDKDESVNFKDSIKLKSYIKNSKLILLKNADHNYSDKKDFNKVIKKTVEFIVKNIK